MNTLDNFSFKIDGCLPVGTKAKDQRTAEARIQQAWPRSKIEFLGVNIESAMRDEPKNTESKKAIRHSPSLEPVVSPTGLSEAERSVIDAYAGH